jgi:hypothetical protein
VVPEPEGSSPHSQQPANGPHPEPGESTPHPQPISLRSILIPSSHLRLGLSSDPFPSGFPTKTLYYSDIFGIYSLTLYYLIKYPDASKTTLSVLEKNPSLRLQAVRCIKCKLLVRFFTAQNTPR